MENSVCHYDWCYVSGRVNVLECSLLSSNFFERLLSTADFKDVLANLNNTPLKAYFTHVKHLYEFEVLLDEYYYNRLDEIRSLSPDSAVCDFFLLGNDVHNLKIFIKSKILGASVDKFFRGTMSRDEWDDVWQDRATALPEVFRESVSLIKKIIMDNIENRPPSYSTIQKEELNHSPLEKGGQGGFTIPSHGGMKKEIQSLTIQSSPPLQGGDEGGVKKETLPFIIDLIIDGAYLRYVEDYCKKIEVEIIKRYLETYQLVKGLEIIRRAVALKLNMNLLNQYFMEGFDKEHVLHKLTTNTVWASEKTLCDILVNTHCDTYLSTLTKNLFPKISFRYEVATDNYLLDVILPVKRVPFGPERVFGYLCGLTAEVFNLKLLLGGKVHRVENNLLRERLRKTYA
jgi:vacuolar-type H+-ATPase subunit C/Vma6